MGSIVVDAVNHFFHPHPHSHQPTAAEHLTPRSPVTRPVSPPYRAPHTTQPYTPMSVTGSRAGSSLATAAGTAAASNHYAPARHEGHEQQQQQQNQQGQNASPQPHMPSRSSTRPRPSSPHAAVTSQSHADSSHSSLANTSARPESSASGSSRTHSLSTDASSTPPQRIVIKDLAHIQSLADSDMQAFTESGQGLRQRSGDNGPQYEISGMPIEHIIEMVAGLLTKITTANDMQHEHLHRHMPAHDTDGSMNRQTTSVLAFHGKNVPSITILSYLNRINKYCPTSYEVFLSLLVYFDRMTEKVNSGPMQNLREATERAAAQQGESTLTSSSSSTQDMEGVAQTSAVPTQTATPPMSGELEKQSQGMVPGTPHSRPRQPDSPSSSALDADGLNLSHFFVVDSFNIHRLVIAGVTCASKFFSDIFYTNSRYAKVGGLPLPELNHLELQFLLLNDFRLSIPVEEMEAYGTMLVEFYAREVLAQRQAEANQGSRRASTT